TGPVPARGAGGAGAGGLPPPVPLPPPAAPSAPLPPPAAPALPWARVYPLPRASARRDRPQVLAFGRWIKKELAALDWTSIRGAARLTRMSARPKSQNIHARPRVISGIPR